MKEYKNVELDVVELEATDVISTSGDVTDIEGTDTPGIPAV